jgi:hypothetical protein
MLTVRSSSRSTKPKRSTARAPSVAMPRPQNSRASRHPISTLGSTSGRNVGMASVTQPVNWPVSRISTANAP